MLNSYRLFTFRRVHIVTMGPRLMRNLKLSLCPAVLPMEWHHLFMGPQHQPQPPPHLLILLPILMYLLPWTLSSFQECSHVLIMKCYSTIPIPIPTSSPATPVSSHSCCSYILRTGSYRLLANPTHTHALPLSLSLSHLISSHRSPLL